MTALQTGTAGGVRAGAVSTLLLALVVGASSAGTVLEWYGLLLRGAPILGLLFVQEPDRSALA